MRAISHRAVLPLLHLDDSGDDRFMVQEAIFITQTPFLYFGVDCVESAIPHFQPHKGNEFPTPAIVLLDYDLGRRTGLDFLYWLRVMRIKLVPVVMLSWSPDKRPVEQCYATGANYFIRKPKNFVRLKNFVRTLDLSLLPRQSNDPLVLLHEYVADPRGNI